MPVIVSTHPRTKKRLEMLENVKIDDRVQYLKPFGFLDYNYLQLKAKCAVSDSGTISEESSMLNFPAVTIRNSMERPEAIEAGTARLVGTDVEKILAQVRLLLNDPSEHSSMARAINPFGDGHAAERIVNALKAFSLKI